MKSVIVIFAGPPDLERLCEAYGGIGLTNMQTPQRLVVEGEWGWFAIEADEGIDGEFSDTERGRITQLIPEPVYAQLEYSSSSAVNLAIGLMPVTTDTLVDNDHGMLRPVGEVRELIQTGMEWETSSV
jgi:hypothetical protein